MVRPKIIPPMKIAVASEKSSLRSSVAPRFGRAPFYHIYDTESYSVSKYGSGRRENMPPHAGVDAARTLLSAKIDAVIAGDFGQHVATLFRENHVEVAKAPLRAGSWALDEFLRGRLVGNQN